MPQRRCGPTHRVDVDGFPADMATVCVPASRSSDIGRCAGCALLAARQLGQSKEARSGGTADLSCAYDGIEVIEFRESLLAARVRVLSSGHGQQKRKSRTSGRSVSLATHLRPRWATDEIQIACFHGFARCRPAPRGTW